MTRWTPKKVARWRVKAATKKFDLFNFLETNGVEFKIMSSGAYYYLTCWECGKKKLYIHSDEDDDFRGYYKCWVCGNKGDIFDLMAQVEMISRSQAFARIMGQSVPVGDIEQCEDFLKFRFNQWENTVDKPEPKRYDMPLNIKPLLSTPDSKCYTYAKCRGITEEMMKKFNIMGSDNLKRVVFPITYKK